MSYTATHTTATETHEQFVTLVNEDGTTVSFALKHATALIEATLAARKEGYEIARQHRLNDREARRNAREAKRTEAKAKADAAKAAQVAKLEAKLAALKGGEIVTEQPAEAKPARRRNQKAAA